MQPVVGIICEYDPFHMGHAHQFAEIRKILPDALIMCTMSTCFTQRGMPALFSPSDRAEAALRSGANLVFALPTAASVSTAEHFAASGVALLSTLGAEYLSFGAEGELPVLERIADCLASPSDAFRTSLRQALDSGMTYAAAQGEALRRELQISPDAWNAPNNHLAIAYLCAIRKHGCAMKPIPVLRSGDYHAAELAENGFSSATAIRAAWLSGRYAAADAACPHPLPAAPVCRPDALDSVLLYCLRQMSAEQLAALPECSEGLENRLQSACRAAASREELLSLLKTKRYTRARLDRLCTQALLNIGTESYTAAEHPDAAHLLGMRDTPAVREVLRRAAVPVCSRAAEVQTMRSFPTEERAWDLWALGAGLPAGLLLRNRVAVLRTDA